LDWSTIKQDTNTKITLNRPSFLPSSSLHQKPPGDLHQRDIDPSGRGMTPWREGLEEGRLGFDGGEVGGGCKCVTPQVLPWLEHTLALRTVIICGRDLGKHIRSLVIMC
jgi:hypothetical protein